MSPFLEEIMSDSKKAIKRRMSAVSIQVPSRKRQPPQPIEISWPRLIHSTGVYASTSPDRSKLLMDLPSPRPDSEPQHSEQDSSIIPPSLLAPRHSCPDIRTHDHNSMAKDKQFREQKMREFESHIESNKVLRWSITPDYAFP
ncbi:hypothetical protein VKS41_003671 [Umbelopsis sp. WA50703]